MARNLKLLIAPDEIQGIVHRLAKDISNDFALRDPVLLGVLKGASIFLSDLARAINIPEAELDFIQTASYGKRDTPAHEVVITRDATTEIKGRDVIVVEGIIDRGNTVLAVTDYLKTKGPASIKTCTLLLRDGTQNDMDVDYVGFKVGEGYVVGYGLDYKEFYRGLPGIYILEVTNAEGESQDI